jgi:hypothetical protein
MYAGKLERNARRDWMVRLAAAIAQRLENLAGAILGRANPAQLPEGLDAHQRVHAGASTSFSSGKDALSHLCGSQALAAQDPHVHRLLPHGLSRAFGPAAGS